MHLEMVLSYLRHHGLQLRDQPLQAVGILLPRHQYGVLGRHHDKIVDALQHHQRLDAPLDRVSTKISMNLPLAINSRTICRSTRNGEMKEHNTTGPASVISLATSPTRRMFSTRSASESWILAQALANIVASGSNLTFESRKGFR
jgi:hypothetical protein